jgi:hypothetical protein
VRWVYGLEENSMSSAQVWFARQGDVLIATDTDSRKVIDRLQPGECQPFKRIGVRDLTMHHRYWALMTVIARNVRRIEIDRLGGQPVYMPIFNKDNAHTAMKLCTGLYDTLPVGGSDYCVRVPHTTSFEGMTPDEWLVYWPTVLEVFVEKVAPFIEVPEARDDALRYVERWTQEAA